SDRPKALASGPVRVGENGEEAGMRVQRVRPSERFFVTPFFESFAPTLDRHVREIMSTVVVATAPEATPYEVAQALVQERLDLLPVVDRDLRVIGIVSEADLLSRVNFPH